MIASVLRIHFTSEDLARTRIVQRPDPMWELSLSMHQLWLRDSNPMFSVWKAEVTQQFHPSAPARAQVATALALNPPRGYFPDFLTPSDSGGDLEEGLQAVMSTPKVRLRQEVQRMSSSGHPITGSVRDIGVGEAKALDGLGDAMRRYYEIAVAPIWSRVVALVDADRSRRARMFLDDGWAALLSSLHPTARYDGGVLEVGAHGSTVDSDVHLDGRGLVLIPSYFKETRQLMMLADKTLPPVLVYPIDPMIRAEGEGGRGALANLLGQTRAAVLESAAGCGTTTEIGRAVGISIPGASKHLSVLRSAGLVRSQRVHNTVFHELTTLGCALLAGAR